MKRYTSGLLILGLIFPLVTIFFFDSRYNQLQSKECMSQDRQYICNNPELKEREKIITTAFYRHIGDYLGREVGTSASFLDQEAKTDHQLKERIGDFNKVFLVSMFVSIVFASVSATLLIQKVIVHHSIQNNKPHRNN